MDRFGDINEGSPASSAGWVSGEEVVGEEERAPNLQAEGNAYERVGMPGASSLMCGTEMGGKMGDLQKKINRMTQDPEQRFVCYVDAISRNLMSNDNVHLGQEDIDTMINAARNLKDVSKKNPTAYILGYIASKGGRKLEKKSFDSVVKNVLPLTDVSAGVTPPDIIRYSRLWETL